MRSRVLAFLIGVGGLSWVTGLAAQQPTSMIRLNAVAESYVKLVLALGELDPGYVDAYYGPPEWKKQAQQRKRSLDEIASEADRLIQEAGTSAPADITAPESAEALRHTYLLTQLAALRARTRMLRGEKLSFDAESKALYDAVAPVHTEADFQEILDQLDRTVSGSGALIARYDAFREQFIIPRDRVNDVFTAAIAECRRRTAQHITLPPDESFTLEYVTNKSWSGYNWYQGNYRSLIQINTDLPIYVDRAVDLACHEGYPGHHVYNVLLEKTLVRDRGWIEMTVYPLFSPQSLIAEGSANFGIEVAFPGEQRAQFEREVLFPAAGMDPGLAARYYEVQALIDRLSYAGNEAARRYLNGELDRDGAAAWLVKYALMSPARAEQRTRFIDDYRSYVINYNLGKDLVKEFVEARGGTASQPERRWQIFADLISSQRLPSGFR